MSRVSSTPAYQDQAAHVCLLYTDLASEKNARNKFVLDRIHKYGDGKEAAMDAAESRFNIIYEECVLGEDENFEHERFCYSICLNKDPMELRTAGVSFGKIIYEVLDTAARWYSDGHAIMRLILRTLNNDITYRIPSYMSKAVNRADILSSKLAACGMMCDKMGGAARSIAMTKFDILRDKNIKHLFAASQCWSKILRSSPVRQTEAAHNSIKLLDRNYDSGIRGFEMKNGYFDMNTDESRVYRIQGMTFVVIGEGPESEGFLLDRAAMEYLRECMIFWFNSSIYWKFYRRTGNMDTDQGNVYEAFKKIVRYLGRFADQTVEKEFNQIARHAKTTMAIMMEEFGAKGETLDVHYKERVAELHKSIAETAPMIPSVYNIFESIPVSDRAKMDLCYFFHGFPPCHADLYSVFRNVHEKLSNSNPVDATTFEHFFNYTKSLHLALVCTRTKGNVRHKTVPGYTLEDKDWWISCTKGKFRQAPVAELGKAWIEGHFTHTYRLENWFWEASDVTHVNQIIDEYSTASSFKDIPQNEHNELAYAMRYAPKLSRNKDPSYARAILNNNQRGSPGICQIAIKAENAKLPDNMRETYSASDIMREITSEADRSAIAINYILPNVTLRKAPSTMAYDQDIIVTDSVKCDRVINVSSDVSGWSPNANREYMMKFFDYIFRMSKVPDTFGISKCWDNLNLAVNKRGMNIITPCKTGMFQGFTGSLDTCLHSAMDYFVIHTAKLKGIIAQDEKCKSATLIDDALMSIVLNPNREDVQDTADKFLGHVIETYKLLGFKIDPVKTMYSTKKINYLNKFFAFGSEVVQASKTFGKIADEVNTRFRTLFDKIHTIIQRARGAAAKGGDPIITYKFAFFTSLIYCNTYYKTDFKLDDSAVIPLLFAPPGFGGLQLPTFAQWITNEVVDPLTAYVHNMQTYFYNFKEQHPNYAFKFLNNVNFILGQNLSVTSPHSILCDPQHVATVNRTATASSFISPSDPAVKKNITSKIFREAIGVSTNNEDNAAIDCIVRSFTWDISIMSEFGKCLPEELAKTFRDKIFRSELITRFMSAKFRRDVINRIKRDDSKHFRFMIKLLRNAPQVEDILTKNSHYIVARDIRDAFYKVNSVHIVNHTSPYPIGMLSRCDKISTDRSAITVTFDLPKACGSDKESSIWGSNRDSYANMYDGKPKGKRFYGRRSRAPYIRLTFQDRGSSAVQKIVSRAIAFCSFIKDRSGPGDLLFSIISSAWGVESTECPVSTTLAIDKNVSTKRLGNVFGNRNHIITVFPNTLNTVNIDSTGAERSFERVSCHADTQQIVNCMKGTMSVDLAAHKSHKAQLKFAWKPDTMPTTDPTLIDVLDDKLLAQGMSLFAAKVELASAFKKAAEIESSIANSAKEVTYVAIDNNPVLEIPDSETSPEIDMNIKFGKDAPMNVEAAAYAAAQFREIKLSKYGSGDIAEVAHKLSVAAARKYCKIEQLGDYDAYLFASYYAKVINEIVPEAYTTDYLSSETIASSLFDDVEKTYDLVSRKVKSAFVSEIFSQPTSIWPQCSTSMIEIAKFKGGDSIKLKGRYLVWLWMLSNGIVPSEDHMCLMARSSKRTFAKQADFLMNKYKLLGDLGAYIVFQGTVTSLTLYQEPSDAFAHMMDCICAKLVEVYPGTTITHELLPPLESERFVNECCAAILNIFNDQLDDLGSVGKLDGIRLCFMLWKAVLLNPKFRITESTIQGVLAEEEDFAGDMDLGFDLYEDVDLAPPPAKRMRLEGFEAEAIALHRLGYHHRAHMRHASRETVGDITEELDYEVTEDTEIMLEEIIAFSSCDTTDLIL